MTVAIDSNLLIYSTDTIHDRRQEIARDIVARALLTGAILPVQAIGEFLAVTRRKRPEYFFESISVAQSWQALGQSVATTDADVISAAQLVARHKFQFWDAVIWSVSAAAGARWLLSEDMHDGFSLGGLTIINPLLPANAAKLDAILPPLP